MYEVSQHVENCVEVQSVSIWRSCVVGPNGFQSRECFGEEERLRIEGREVQVVAGVVIGGGD